LWGGADQRLMDWRGRLLTHSGSHPNWKSKNEKVLS
jgi:hypothetical protein